MKFHLHVISLFLLLSSSAVSYLVWKEEVEEQKSPFCLDLKLVIWKQYIKFVS